MFFNRNKENKVYPCKPQFYYIKVGLKGVKIIQACFRDAYVSIKNITRVKGPDILVDFSPMEITSVTSCLPFCTPVPF